jgi:hypothetical protein
VWFAEPLLSSTNDEVRRVLARARHIAEALEIPLSGWMSDKQDAFVGGIAKEFPGVPHRYCENHFLRDLAKPLLEKDSHAKVQMRRKVRGLRSISRPCCVKNQEAGFEASRLAATCRPERRSFVWTLADDATEEVVRIFVRRGASSGTIAAARNVLELCGRARILNDDKRPAPSPGCGWRMAEGGCESQRNLEEKKGCEAAAFGVH